MRTLDDIDIRLLQLLQADGRITNADLAKSVGLSPPSVLARVRALEQAGLIRGYHAILDPDRLGLRLTAFVMISLSLHQEQPIERFRKAVLAIPEVQECWHLSGDFDFMLKVIVKDMRAYETLIREKITKIRGLQKIQTSFVMNATKWSPTLPLA